MTVGKMNVICWTLFVVGCVLCAPCLLAAIAMHSPLLIVAFAVAWWAPFVYAMYLAMAVMRNGDRRLLRRGIQGTAAVLSAKATNTVIQEGEFAWEAPRVYKYELLVSIPDREPYKTTCRICASSIRQGQTVRVAVSKHNRKRVTIDVGQGQHGGSAARPAPVVAPVPAAHHSGYAGSGVGLIIPSTESGRLTVLAQLGQLHERGVITDAEFAEQKARILNN